MIVSVYVKREDLVKLEDFLTKGSILDICWSERMYLDHIQVNLEYSDYMRLLEISSKMEEAPEEPEIEEDVNFWSLPEEELAIFNEKGLFSFQQMTAAFLAGSTYFNSLQEQEAGNVFSKPLDFKTWFESHVLRNSTAE
jgi:hypothetical protein